MRGWTKHLSIKPSQTLPKIIRIKIEAIMHGSFRIRIVKISWKHSTAWNARDFSKLVKSQRFHKIFIGCAWVWQMSRSWSSHIYWNQKKRKNLYSIIRWKRMIIKFLQSFLIFNFFAYVIFSCSAKSGGL